MTRRRWLSFVVALAVVGGTAATALGVAGGDGPSRIADDGAINSASDTHGWHHHHHGGAAKSSRGTLPAGSENVRLIGEMRINQDQEGRVADVGVFGTYAYLGAYYEPACQKGGVYVFDIANPARPKQINFIRTANNTYVGEGVQVIHIDAPRFNGDVLVMNNEICGPAKTGAKGGVSFVDVTKPKTHKYLAEGVGDFLPAGANGAGIAHTVHSAFMWDVGDKAYAVLVDNEELADVDILDITDPRSPVLVAEHDLVALAPHIAQPEMNEIFHHDVVVKQVGDRWLMLVSYWDGGYVVLDVTDPVNPTYVADTDFASVDPLLLERTGASRPPEGNAHEAEYTLDDAYVVAADEDFAPYSMTATNLDDGSTIDNASPGSDTPGLAEGESIEGDTVFVGRACPGDTAVPAASAAGQIAVVERGVCLFTEKLANVDGKGYAAMLVFDREGADGCRGLTTMNVAGATPSFGVVPRVQGMGLFGAEGAYDEESCLAGDGTETVDIAVGTPGDRVRIESYFDGWGYVHLFRNGAGKLADLDTYAVPEAHDPAFANGFGDLSVHEAATSHRDPGLVYFAYYAAGFRVVRIVEDELVEVGHFIAPGGSNFWGVQVWEHAGREYVLASDRDHGVYIFEYTGP